MRNTLIQLAELPTQGPDRLAVLRRFSRRLWERLNAMYYKTTDAKKKRYKRGNDAKKRSQKKVGKPV